MKREFENEFNFREVKSMTQFYIIEVKKIKGLNGEADSYEHEVHWAFDADANTARLKAESKYHEILARAAVSEYAQHSATLLTSDGRAIMNQCYRHEVEPTPDPVEPEEDTPAETPSEEDTPTEDVPTEEAPTEEPVE